MPYIRPTDRQAFDTEIKALVERITCEGEANYVITRIIAGAMRSVSYASINAAIGTLECAKLELYRRLAGPYEDTKVATNGDVPEYRG
jgi:hypothetical protein